MNCRVTMKCPDSLRTAIEEMVEGEIGAGDPDNLDQQEELDAEFDNLVSKCMTKAEKWFSYGEYITVEIDFENNTCTVVE